MKVLVCNITIRSKKGGKRYERGNKLYQDEAKLPKI